LSDQELREHAAGILMMPFRVWSVALSLALFTEFSLTTALAGEAEITAAPVYQAPAFVPLTLGSIKPSGWLKDQLRIQRAGLSGHLDEFWPDIKDSAWFGGKAEGWERVPYWLDGIVPLAYLLDDGELKTKAKRAIDTILDRQQSDGWLGPVGDTQNHKPYDVWPLFPLFKALTQYQEASGDPRVVPALLKCCRKIDQVISREPLYSWAKVRAADLAISLYWLYDRTKEPWLLELADKAFAQSHDWRAMFENFPFTTKARDRKDLDNHGVNTGMGLKFGGVRYRLTADAMDKDAIFSMLDILDRYHGQATGIFTCDEHLAGRNPSQGTELCTVAEAMYSLEVLAAVQGDTRLGDRLEKLAFNALPATFKKDMTAHQYDQQCNQVICSAEGAHVYTSNGSEANLYGLEPNFGCCTANLHQGWPKFASSLWMWTPDDGLAVVAYAPCVIETKIQGKPVKVTVETMYPFRSEVAITVTVPEPMTFPVLLRIPAWAKGFELKQSDGSEVKLWGIGEPQYSKTMGKWSGSKTLHLRLPMEARLYQGYNGAVAIERGPLVFALPIETEWKKLRDRPNLPFDDWEVYPKSPWNYALEIDREHPERAIVFEDRAIGANPFSPAGAPVVARVNGRRLVRWGLERGAAAPPPQSPVISRERLEELTLIPYGCTDLRLTEFPILATP
jgi:uncharacterized protein